MPERQCKGIARASREGRWKGRLPTARRQATERGSTAEGGGRQALGNRQQTGYWTGIGISRAGGTVGQGSGGGMNETKW